MWNSGGDDGDLIGNVEITTPSGTSSCGVIDRTTRFDKKRVYNKHDSTR